ncbi:MAG: pepN, partial [bacterium]
VSRLARWLVSLSLAMAMAASLVPASLTAVSAGEPIDDAPPFELSRPDRSRPTNSGKPIERPHYFEPTPEGWPGLTLDERDVAPYLAFHRSAGIVTTSSRSLDVLTVNLDRSYANGETITVQVTYFGTPAGGYFGFSTSGGQPMIWSLSEPFGARTWWPCKDYSDDKADSVDIRIRVPSNLVTASNGTRILNTNDGTFATTKWTERYPIATYLVFVASHPYTVASDWYVTALGDSVPLQFYMFPASVAQATPNNALVNDMMAAYAPLFGEYPFVDEKYGHAQFLFSGGMEHQTCTCLGVYVESITAHELAHQWWGDKVTCGTFHHIWLNEGFATYGEALWAESLGGAAARNAEMDLAKYFGAGTVHVPDVNDENRIFSSNLSYNKGSWVLHMLRGILGDVDFFDALQAYGTQFAYASAVSEDLRDVFEDVSGKDLHPFFQQWIYGEYYPQYQFTWSSVPAAGGYDVHLTINQTQSWQLFTLPIQMRVSTSGGDVDFTVGDSLATQAFVLHVDDPPTDVALDPDEWILKSVDVPIGVPSFDRSILVVNGVDWATYGAEITNAYAAEAFWGDYGIDFWDYFPAPGGGYPGTLPAPLGHGAVPASVMRHYRNVIWVGNNFNGDLSGWYDSPIESYLGVTWTANGTTITDCVSIFPGLTSIARIGTQNLVSVFSQTLTHPDADLLYRAEAGFTPDVGIGVLRRPSAGGTYRLNGGRFLFLSGRPYRWNPTDLKNNIMYMLTNFFFEPLDQSAVPEAPVVPAAAILHAIRPNPMSGVALLSFDLAEPGSVTLSIVDVGGRLVRRLIEAPLSGGAHEATWDGRDGAGSPVASGTYFAVLDAAGRRWSRTLVRVR